jgi:hypothetical protein
MLILQTATGSPILQAALLDPDGLALGRVRAVVAGREADIPRGMAMALLLASDFPNKHRDFQEVLENDNERPEVRYLAAIYLGRINTPAARGILLESARIRDPQVLAGVAKALGRIGDQSALPILSRVAEQTTGFPASAARFAAGLIVHRLGLAGYDLLLPAEAEYLNLPEGVGRTLKVDRAHEGDVQFCLRSLASQPLGVEFAERPAYQVRCGSRMWLILLNRDLAGPGAVSRLMARKTLLMSVAARNQETGFYSVRLLVLTRPGEEPGRIDVLIYRPTGDVILGGQARVEADQALFMIRAVSRPGAAAVLIRGTFRDGELAIETALSSAVVVRPKRQPLGEP